jgi:hypothetical protein
MWSVLAVVAVAGAVTVVLAQAPEDGGHHQAAAAPAGDGTLAPEQQRMMRMMAADDEKLAGLIRAMNAARGDQKVAAIADVINELVAQRTSMRTQMMRMQAGMDQMMSHMATMHGAGGMMNKKAPEPVPPVGEPDHAAHHPEK